jgi:hypothetical protein
MITTLPIEGDWNVLKRWGVTQGDRIDNFFCQCTLPEGWKKVPTKDTTWLTNLIDSRGLIRAAITNNNRGAIFCSYDIDRFAISNSHIYKTGDPPLHHEQYQVVDKGLSRYVFIDNPVCSGVMDSEIVAIKDDKVYSLEAGTLLLKSNTQECKNIKLLDMNEFFDNWRRHDSANIFLSARRKLAIFECQKYISQLPTDDSIWESAFDFPEIAPYC